MAAGTKGRCLSLYGYLTGRLEHLYVCMGSKKHKGIQTGESWLKLRGGNTNTNHTGEAYLPLGPASMESLLCINDEITCLLWESKVCFA